MKKGLNLTENDVYRNFRLIFLRYRCLNTQKTKYKHFYIIIMLKLRKTPKVLPKEQKSRRKKIVKGNSVKLSKSHLSISKTDKITIKKFKSSLINDLIKFMNHQLKSSDNSSENYVSMGLLSPATTSTSSCNEDEIPLSRLHSNQIKSPTVDHHEQHILEPLSHSTNGMPAKRPCLTWACKACKKKSVAIDRRKAATLRERRRLRKVSRKKTKKTKNFRCCFRLICCKRHSDNFKFDGKKF